MIQFDRIAERSGIPEDHLKLISCGSVLQDAASIHSQHVRHGSQVMVICLSETEIEARGREKQATNLIKTKEAAAILAKRKDGRCHDNFFTKIPWHTNTLNRTFTKDWFPNFLQPRS